MSASLLLLLPLAWSNERESDPTSAVTVLPTPNGGLQPQAVIDSGGKVHLIYYKGPADAGDLFYVRGSAQGQGFSEPIRINNQPGSAVAVGTVRGGQLAVGRGGRVHVAWNGSNKAREGDSHPMLYARLNDAGTAFEPQRNLMKNSTILDGGGTVAADDAGNVYVAWQALPNGSERGEDKRQMFIARSTDDGRTFAAETPATMQATGACACCSTKAFTDRKGSLFIQFRGAKDNVNRDMVLLTTTDHGQRFTTALLHPWKIATCPMSTMAFAEGPKGVVAAWDTNGQIHWALLDPNLTTDLVKPHAAPGMGHGRKHPSIAVNSRGETLLVWTEGTGWQKGGALVWQVFDAKGAPTADKGRFDRGIPTWGLPTAVAVGDGFLVWH